MSNFDQVAKLAADTLLPNTPIGILRDWIREQGTEEADVTHAVYCVLTLWWDAVADYKEAASKARAVLAEIVAEVTTGPRRTLYRGSMEEDYDHDPQVETIGDVLAAYTGQCGHGREWRTYSHVFQEAVRDVVLDMAEGVRAVLDIDSNDYEPFWSMWRNSWEEAIDICPDASLADQESWLC